jgi:hypothetical protein
MKRQFLLILIALALLLSAASAVASKDKRDDQKHQAKLSEENTVSHNQQAIISPAFYAAILGELRAFINEEVAERKQQHADHEDWDTPMFWATVGLIVVGGGYVLVGLCQLAAIKGQANIAAKTLVEQSRPWISVNLEVISPFVFDEMGCHVTVKWDLRNVGNSVAIGIEPYCVLFACGKDHNPMDELRRIGAQLRNSKVDPSIHGYVLFPTEKLLPEFTLMLSKQQIADTAMGEFFMPAVVGVVDYQASFEGKSMHHQTGFIFNFFYISTDPPGLYGVRFNQTVPIANLKFVPSPSGGHYAD